MTGEIYYKNDWAFLSVDPNLGKYLRKLLLRGNGTKLQAPSNGSHITLADPMDNFSLLGFLDFDIMLRLETNGNAFWYPVLIDLQPRKIPYHYCIGYLQQPR